MLQLNSRTTTLSFNEIERNSMNENLAKFQEKQGNFDTLKGLFFAITESAVSNVSSNEIQVQTIEKFELSEDVQTKLSKLLISSENPYEIIFKLIEFIESSQESLNFVTDENIKLNIQLDEIRSKQPENTEKPQDEIQEITTENPNEIILNLRENQIEVLKIIQENRFAKLKAKGLQEETFAEIIEKSFFNKATLHNWHGNFYTGI